MGCGAREAPYEALQVKARQQLGTVGSGNHYVDVFADEAGALWVGVHFGSRGFGHTVASAFLAIGQGARWGDRVPEKEVLLPLDQPSGHDYWQLMELAGRYAYAGREWVARKVVSLLGGRELEMVHNHHNFAWKEMHDGEELVVVRKGATPAFPGSSASSADPWATTRSSSRAPRPMIRRSSSCSASALFSTVHGAGRVMSRTAAAGKRNRKTGQVLSEGRVSPEMMRSWVTEKGVVLRGGGLDESPHVYRRLPDVLAAQGGTIEVAACAPAAHRGHGRGGRVRSLQGLIERSEEAQEPRIAPGLSCVRLGVSVTARRETRRARSSTSSRPAWTPAIVGVTETVGWSPTRCKLAPVDVPHVVAA